MTKHTNTNTILAFADAIAADVERRNNALDRNADGSWPPMIDGATKGEDRRFTSRTAMMAADNMISALHQALHGYHDRAGVLVNRYSLHQQAAEVAGKIAQKEDEERGKDVSDWSDASAGYYDRLCDEADSVDAIIAAAQALIHDLESIYLDAAAGTETKWTPYDQRAKAKTTAPALSATARKAADARRAARMAGRKTA